MTGLRLENVCVISAVSGNYKAQMRSIDGYVFSNSKNISTEGQRWNIIADDFFEHKDPFMRAKYYKCQWHKIPILAKYDIVVWIDATIQIKKLPIQELNSADVVVYNHGVRTNTHSECKASLGTIQTMMMTSRSISWLWKCPMSSKVHKIKS